MDFKGLVLDNFQFGGLSGLERTDFGLLADLALPGHNL